MLQRQMRREKRKKQNMKLKKSRRDAEEAIGSDEGLSDVDEAEKKRSKILKIHFNSDSEDEGYKAKKSIADADRISLAEQETLAFKLLSSCIRIKF
jgi:hypothetical protein